MDMLTIAAALVATLFGLLVAIVSFIGSKIIHQLDTLADKLQDIAGELHTRITGLDLRLTRVETKIEDKQ
jgi:biopolymer transport protein ExbB/TolQ